MVYIILGLYMRLNLVKHKNKIIVHMIELLKEQVMHHIQCCPPGGLPGKAFTNPLPCHIFQVNPDSKLF